MRKKLRLLTILTVVCSLFGCGETEFEYSGHHAYFVFDNSLHLDPTLSSAMNVMSPGIFCRISIQEVNRINFDSNQGLSSQATLNAVELKRRMELGIFNGSGVIVGFATLSQPVAFCVYDAQCPNCYDETMMPRYMLTMDTAGKATCKSCGRTYDLNNDGIISSGNNGKKLFHYRAQTTGPFGVLSINN
ncbi:MAG: hypothetical protein K5893_07810 [Prevotella sp.]|nr:hypothetical protein [Prevotella sp.]